MKLLKQITVSALALAAGLLLTTGCVAVTLSNSIQPIPAEGARKSVQYKVGSYDSIRIEEYMEVVYKNRVSDQVKVEIEESLIPYLEVKVEKGCLVVKSKKNVAFQWNEDDTPPVIYISTPV